MSKLVFLESVKKMPLMSLPVRSTFLALNGGGVLISPGSCLSINQLQQLKGVSDLVAPNLFHCAGISQASSVFPAAKKWAPVGGKKLKSEISWSEELSVANWPYQGELPMIEIKGMPKVNEVVFYHRESKSLIIADLCFNMEKARGVGPWIILNLFGTYKRFAISKFFAKFITDKSAFEQSLQEIFSLDFENIILGHGDNIIGGGKNRLLQALSERGLAPR